MTNEKQFTICKIAIGLFIILTFTPLITPNGVHQPECMGMPYTLWVGILEAFLLVGITWYATRVHPSNERE